MGRKTNSNMSTPQLQSQTQQLSISSVKQEPPYSQQSHPQQRQMSSSRTSTPTPNGTIEQHHQIQRTHSLGNGPYYNTSMAPSTSYPQMAYSEVGHTGVPTPNPGASSLPQSYDSNESAHQYLYAASAAAAAMASTAVAGPESTSNNPLAGYATQATQQHGHNMSNQGGQQGTSGGDWPGNTAHTHGMHHGQTNPWHDWTNAIMEPTSNQDRYSANALLTLGGPQRDTSGAAQGMSGPGGGHVAAPGGASGHNSGTQWPMLLFHDGSVSGG